MDLWNLLAIFLSRMYPYHRGALKVEISAMKSKQEWDRVSLAPRLPS